VSGIKKDFKKNKKSENKGKERRAEGKAARANRRMGKELIIYHLERIDYKDRNAMEKDAG
jgi:hypothetical protein